MNKEFDDLYHTIRQLKDRQDVGFEISQDDWDEICVKSKTFYDTVCGEEEIEVKVYLDDGLVQEVKKPNNVKVIVYDLDIEGVVDEVLEKDDEGRECFLSEWD